MESAKLKKLSSIEKGSEGGKTPHLPFLFYELKKGSTKWKN